MKLLLRIIAAWEALLAVLFLLLAGVLVLGGGLTASDPRGLVVVVGFLLLPPVAGFAAVQLWRLRESGRQASIGLMALSMVISVAQGASLTVGTVIRWFLMVALLAFLLSPRVRSICAQQASSPEPKES